MPLSVIKVLVGVIKCQVSKLNTMNLPNTILSSVSRTFLSEILLPHLHFYYCKLWELLILKAWIQLLNIELCICTGHVYHIENNSASIVRDYWQLTYTDQN